MDRQNLMGHEDMPAGALRQRRDLYALSIGLSIFYLAGGELLEGTQQGIIGMKLTRPWFILVAAWVGYFYFMFRLGLWKRLDAAWADFMLEAQHQAMFTSSMREHIRNLIPKENQSYDAVMQSIDRGLIPKFKFQGEKTTVTLSKFYVTVSQERTGNPEITHLMAERYSLTPEAAQEFRRQMRRGWMRAVLREHSFTNYVLPYLFAMLPLFLGIYDGTRQLVAWVYE